MANHPVDSHSISFPDPVTSHFCTPHDTHPLAYSPHFTWGGSRWQSASGWSPVYVDDNLGVMSIGFMLPNADDAIIWRGPRKNGGSPSAVGPQVLMTAAAPM